MWQVLANSSLQLPPAASLKANLMQQESPDECLYVN